MTMAFNTKINPKKMKKLEKEYAIVKTKEQEEQGELRVFYLNYLHINTMFIYF